MRTRIEPNAFGVAPPLAVELSAVFDPDQSVYSFGNVIVTRTLIRIRGISYPVNGVVSVYVARPKRMAAIIVAVVFLGMGSATLTPDNSVAHFLLFIGAIFLLVAALKPYVLVLQTASGSHQAVASRRKASLFEIKIAIEKAVALRG